MSEQKNCQMYICRCFCHSQGFAGDITQHVCIDRDFDPKVDISIGNQPQWPKGGGLGETTP